MAEHPVFILVILGFLAWGGVVAVLHVVTSRIRHEVTLHDLKRRVAELQSEVAIRERDQRERDMFVGVVEDDIPDLAA